jgi:hypothetical protein
MFSIDTINAVLKIMGSGAVRVNSSPKNYTSPADCPESSECTWWLGNSVLEIKCSRTISILFEMKHIGKQKLSYRCTTNDHSNTLAEISVRVSHKKETCWRS